MTQIHNFFKTHPILLIGIVLVLFVQLYYFGFGLSHIPGDLGDSRFNMYLLEHAYQYFSMQTPTLWTAPFLYPETEVLTYSDNLLGTAPFYALFRLLGFERELSFQFWVLLMAILNFSTAYLFLKYLLKDSWSALFGGLIFACSLALVSQIAHAQTFPRFPIPLIFWALLTYLKSKDWKPFAALAFLLVYQFYCGIYLGLLTTIIVGIFLLIDGFLHLKQNFTRPNNFKKYLQHILVAVGGLLLFLPLYLPYARRSNQIGNKDWTEVLETMPTFRSYFSISEGSWWNQILGSTDTLAFWDHWIFPGALAILGLIFLWYYAFKNRNTEQGKTWILFAFGSFFSILLFLRMGDFSIFEYLRKLPGLGGLRSLTRVINIQLLFFACGFALLVRWLIRRFPKYKYVFIPSILLLFILDNHVNKNHISRYEKSISLERTNSLVKKLKKMNLPERTVISYHPDTIITHPVDYQLDAMLASQSLHLRCVNGYSSMSPDGFASYWLEPNKANMDYWFYIQEKVDLLDEVVIVQ